MLADAARAWRSAPDFARHANVALIEASPLLADMQRQRLAGADVPVNWHADLSTVPEGPLIVLANEFLDALPIRQFIRRDGVWRERMVTVDDNGGFEFVAGPVAGDVTLAERWRLSIGIEELDYERDLTVLPRIASLNLLSASALTLANSFLDHDRFLAVERDLGAATVLSLRFARDESAVDGAELDTIEGAVLFPLGRRVDLEVDLGHGGSDFFQSGYYGGLLLLIYGGG